MSNIALHIKPRDWFYILITGIVFGMVLSSMGYILLGFSYIWGGVFGVILGFSITLFSLVFITYMNKYLLPNIDKKFWIALAALFSFLSGFLGSYFGVWLARLFSVELIPAFDAKSLQMSMIIGVLTYVVGALLYRFVKMRNQKEKVDNEFMQSRIRSLETQLNPHFLFNALNSIAELIHQDPNKAEQAVLQVSSFLRNTMSEKASILLYEEMSYVKDYVALENIRFSGKIKLHMPKVLPGWRVPKFSIQLLVENAIKHGFDSSMDELNIELELLDDERALVLKNDGKAMKNPKFGIGLQNLKQRLELLCKGDIVIEDTQNVRVKVVLGECHENIDS